MMARFATVTAAAAIITTTAPAAAQEYPSKTVRIVTSEAGAGSDFVARLAGQGLTAALGQQFIVDNRAGGVIAGEAVARLRSRRPHAPRLRQHAVAAAPHAQADALRPVAGLRARYAGGARGRRAGGPSVAAGEIRQGPDSARARPSRASSISARPRPEPPTTSPASSSSRWRRWIWCAFPTAAPHRR